MDEWAAPDHAIVSGLARFGIVPPVRVGPEVGCTVGPGSVRDLFVTRNRPAVNQAGRACAPNEGRRTREDSRRTMPSVTRGALEHFRHFRACPRCGATTDRPNEAVPFRCGPCGFVLYFNAAAAVAAFVRREDGQVLFIRRAKDPGRGKLGLPGGFVDFGETAEEATRREVREEVGLALGRLSYLASFPNRYVYAGVTYHTLDMFFQAERADGQEPRALDAVQSLCWLDPGVVDLEEIAFPSMQSAVIELRRRTR